MTSDQSAPASGRACLIANPAAGRGRAARLLPAAHRAFAGLVAGAVRVTTRAGDEARLTREALAAGCRTVIVLGGDGTWSKVAAALVAERSDACLVPLAAGTGNDLPKSLGLPAADYAAMARIAASARSRTIDVGTVEGHVFVNSAGFGFDVAALEVAARTPWIGGRALYLYAALNLLLRYRGVHAEVLTAAPGRDEPGPAGHYLAVVIANGARFGGSFVIAPDAALDDGRLDVVTIRDAGPIRRVQLLGAVGRGAHTRGFAEVEARTADRVWVRLPHAPLYQTDGELHRATGPTVEVRCLPRALRVPSPA